MYIQGSEGYQLLRKEKNSLIFPPSIDHKPIFTQHPRKILGQLNKDSNEATEINSFVTFLEMTEHLLKR